MPEIGGDKKNISRHILPTASNLLGLCFVIFSIIKAYKFDGQTVLDEMTAFTTLLFLVSSLFSYASIRSKTRSETYEKIADIFFLCGLIAMTLITLVIAFEIVK